MSTVVVFKTGEPPEEIESARGSFFRWIREAAGSHGGANWVEVDAREVAHVEAVTDAVCIIITGSPASVTDRSPWILALEKKVAELASRRVPMLGICFGHQLIAQALGGHVVRNPLGREMGTIAVTRIAADPLFGNLPDTLNLHMTHVDTVERLPPGATLLATTSLDRHAAYAIGDHVRAVQFHPEFDHDIMDKYVTARVDRLRGEGIDPERVRGTIAPTDHGRALIDNFFRAFVGRIKTAA